MGAELWSMHAGRHHSKGSHGGDGWREEAVFQQSAAHRPGLRLSIRDVAHPVVKEG